MPAEKKATACVAWRPWNTQQHDWLKWKEERFKQGKGESQLKNGASFFFYAIFSYNFPFSEGREFVKNGKFKVNSIM